MTWCITAFGVKADGTLCTASIQKAIDTCFLHGGGEVQVPAGRFVTQAI